MWRLGYECTNWVNPCHVRKGYPNFLECTHGDVRLVGGKSESEGRVELCYEGDWYSVCRVWSAAASVLCKQLGYTVYPCKHQIHSDEWQSCIFFVKKMFLFYNLQGLLGSMMENLARLLPHNSILHLTAGISSLRITGLSALHHDTAVIVMEIALNVSVSA